MSETQEMELGMYKVEIDTGWSNAPSVSDLKQDWLDAKPAKDMHTANVTRWLDNLNVTGNAKPDCNPNRSGIQPKVIRKNNEWRYPALSEPFLSTKDMFSITPRTFEDVEAARQNELLVNYQFYSQLNKVKFVDEFVRTAVDEGTVFVRVGWETEEELVETEEPVYEMRPAQTTEQMAALQHYSSLPITHAPDEWKEALQISQEFGVPTIPLQVDVQIKTETKTVKNQPTVEVVDYNNLIIDPSCNGDIDQAKFAVYSFETSKSELEATGLYENLDQITASSSVLNAADSDYDSNDDSSFQFKDEPRKRIVAYEYWGYWDINGTGEVEPIVATWVGDTMIRLSENPYPDKKIPFVSAQYLPVRKSLYGEPDGELLEDNQKIVGAVTRGMIDIMARSANGQVGMRKDMLDVVNRRKFANGEDYEFNQTVDPRQGVHMHQFAEIPASAQFMIQLQQNEAETLTGVRPYGATVDGMATAAEVRGVLDAASKRETAILRRLGDAIERIGRKIISMNQEFLEDEEIIRVTNEKFVAIKREDLAGEYDLVLDISTVEEDNSKAQELAFMLQTVGPNTDPSMLYMIMADIADLRKMPDLAKRLRDYKPEPDPVQQMMQQLELQKLQLENSKVQLEIAKLQSDTGLQEAKTGETVARTSNIEADTDLKNLQYVENELGVQHERDLQKQGAQAKANLQRDVLMEAIKGSQNES
ncbi:portal protein [Vibrio phage 1.097.O._10N.286.49.B3]|uniref:Coil containing protein n=1 Tax=Vibrio phage 1.097.O._10N.286.49.B3 TaxID=1881383 RepID=A0A2I7R0I3_9CAUD|nr:portal protein [Vibrio phage 1.097.O._10N.286.49.B3]AUR87166.1 coil containing protein [Vibrio phage 1.097.O._10N.286.49.B3]